MTNSILEAVQQHPFSQGLTAEHCATLAALGSRVSYARDELIFAEGDQRHEFFFLVKGRVALEMLAQGKALRVHTLEPGDELGWSSVLSGRGKFYQARALEPVETIRFDGYELLEKCRSDNSFGYKIMHGWSAWSPSGSSPLACRCSTCTRRSRGRLAPERAPAVPRGRPGHPPGLPG